MLLFVSKGRLLSQKAIQLLLLQEVLSNFTSVVIKLKVCGGRGWGLS